jgi:hypothetical protein
MRTRQVILPTVFVACAIALGWGCTTEVTSETLPPYASISDEARNPASAPTPEATSDADNSGGVMSTIGDVITWPFRAIGEALGSK